MTYHVSSSYHALGPTMYWGAPFLTDVYGPNLSAMTGRDCMWCLASVSVKQTNKNDTSFEFQGHYWHPWIFSTTQ